MQMYLYFILLLWNHADMTRIHNMHLLVQREIKSRRAGVDTELDVEESESRDLQVREQGSASHLVKGGGFHATKTAILWISKHFDLGIPGVILLETNFNRGLVL